VAVRVEEDEPPGIHDGVVVVVRETEEPVAAVIACKLPEEPDGLLTEAEPRVSLVRKRRTVRRERPARVLGPAIDPEKRAAQDSWSRTGRDDILDAQPQIDKDGQSAASPHTERLPSTQ
jgi:hypothetical protein